MHEYGVMLYLLNAVEDKARELGARRVLSINLVIGDRASIVEDSLGFYFDQMTPGTAVEGAQLNLRRVPSRFVCPGCGVEFTPQNGSFRCPDCGTVGRVQEAGSEFLIESIEIER